MNNSSMTEKNAVETNILSWDVGIKNLAYCMICKTNDSFTIKKWDVINLSNNDKLCQFTIRSGKLCGKTAQFVKTNKDNVEFYNNLSSVYTCSAHKTKIEPVFFDVENKTCMKCKNTATIGISKTNESNFCWCDSHCEKGKEQFIKRTPTKKVTGTSTNCMKQSTQITSEKLYSILDKIPEILQVTEVLIENQPTLKNPTMKTIATLLYSYFIMRGICDKSISKSLINEVRFVCPSNKLKVDKETTNTTLEKNKLNNKKYKMTKKLGVKYCQSLICKKDLAILETYKKKDDLCDAFLQGFQYLFNPIPESYLNKLKSVGIEIIDKNIK